MDWKTIIENEIKNRTGTDGAKKISALRALLLYVAAAEASADDGNVAVIRIEGNTIIFDIPEVLTSIRINAPGEVFGG